MGRCKGPPGSRLEARVVYTVQSTAHEGGFSDKTRTSWGAIPFDVGCGALPHSPRAITSWHWCLGGARGILAIKATSEHCVLGLLGVGCCCLEVGSLKGPVTPGALKRGEERRGEVPPGASDHSEVTADYWLFQDGFLSVKNE